MLTHPSLSSFVTCRLTSGDEKLVWMDHKADYDVNKKTTIKVNSKSLSGPSGYGRRLEFKTVVSSNPVTGYWMDVIFHINWIVFFLKRQKINGGPLSTEARIDRMGFRSTFTESI